MQNQIEKICSKIHVVALFMLNSEPQQLNSEPQQLNSEPQQLNSEPQQLNSELQRLNSEPQQLNSEPQQLCRFTVCIIQLILPAFLLVLF